MIEVFGATDKGKARDLNEDNFLIAENRNGDQILLVCDGIGGSASGEVASAMVCSIVEDAFQVAPVFEKDYQADDWLRKVMTEANDSIYSRSMWWRKYRGMGTTAAGVLLTAKGTYIFNAGDSRIYALYDDGLVRMSEDHSYVQRLVNENKITAREAREHAKKNALTNAVGVWRVFRLDVNKIKSDYSALLICSDGLHGYVPEAKITRTLESPLSLKKKVQLLIDFANEAGGHDNCTVIVSGPGRAYGR